MTGHDLTNMKICDHCGQRINCGFRICPLCGGQVVEPLAERASVCPRCRCGLQSHQQEDRSYDLCPRCGGMWLDRGEFKRATRESDVYGKVNPEQDFQRTPPTDPVAYVPCVRCGQAMSRKNFGRISGVIIDECAQHGVWLDPGELEKIRLFIADGGLERAQDREIEESRVELRRLAVKLDQTAFSHKLIHY